MVEMISFFHNGFVLYKTILDTVDYLEFYKYPFSIHNRGYVVVYIEGEKHYLHRLIGAKMGLNMELQIDHKNLDKLDNRRCNLRSATNQQNNMNRPVQKNNKLGIKGIYQVNEPQSPTRHGLFSAEIKINGKKQHIGYFRILQHAIEARRDVEKKLFGEFYYDPRRTTMNQNQDDPYNAAGNPSHKGVQGKPFVEPHSGGQVEHEPNVPHDDLNFEEQDSTGTGTFTPEQQGTENKAQPQGVSAQTNYGEPTPGQVQGKPEDPPSPVTNPLPDEESDEEDESEGTA